MIKRLILICAATAIIGASSTAMAGFPYRYGWRGYYAPVPAPVVRSYSYVRPPAVVYSPYRSYSVGSYYSYPSYRSYYRAPAYVPAPSATYVAPYSGGGVSVAAPGVSLRIGF